MAKRAKKKHSKKKAKVRDGWKSLTWEDLDSWAGERSVSRGRAYQRQGRVEDLAIGDDGRLLASVVGGSRYYVAVRLNTGRKKHDKIESCCTCPVGYNCKHAVATVAAYLQALADGEKTPTAAADDPRWDIISGDDAEYEDDLDDWEDDGWDADDEEQFETKPSKRRSSSREKLGDWDKKLEKHIRDKSREELIEQVLSLVKRYPELREEYRERIALSEGDVDRLVAQARHEMRERSSEIGWQNHWNDEGYTPNYDSLKHRLERLVELGHADAVVKLGRVFIVRAASQVEQSHDEGETAMAAAECFPVIFAAVAKSKLSGAEKIIFAIDACLEDDYDMLDDSVEAVLGAKWKAADWSEVADKLAGRLAKDSKKDGDSWSRDYHRNRLSDWLLTALENAGRGKEMLAVCESEAVKTGSYERLVRRLIAAKRFEDAELWAREGMDKTREKLPGIASSLASLLCEVSRGRKQWGVVAAHAACAFFKRPSRDTFDKLVAGAKKAKCAEAVRAAALQFLETGKPPFMWVNSAKTGQSLRIDSAWPLPLPDYLQPLLRPDTVAASHGPHYHVLLDMAIADKRADDVLHWFDKMPEQQRHYSIGNRWFGEVTANQVAAAVAKTHPERALEIYQHGLKQVLPHADISSYEAAARYLSNMRPIMKSLGREADWTKSVAEIRAKYSNRPRFMEILDKLDGRTILQSQKVRKRR